MAASNVPYRPVPAFKESGLFYRRDRVSRLEVVSPAAGLQSGRCPTYIVMMDNSKIDERFRCAAEDRAAQQACLGVEVRYEEIGERLMEFRKIAWDRYGVTALWYVPPHATYAAMEEVADGLRSNGDLEAAYLAAAILKEIKSRTARAT